ncbi:MAG: hypothetical protein AB7T31_18320 [Gemmatimonadales bacterium]
MCQVEWWDDRGRQQRSLRTVLGEAVTDKTLARDIAEAMSSAQESKRNRAAAALVFGAAGKGLDFLLKRLHEEKLGQKKWTPKYAGSQERHRTFWLELLGKDVPLAKVHRLPLRAMVDEHGAQQKPPWSERTKQSYLRYLVDAFIYGRDVLKIIDSRHDLSGHELPTPNKKGPSYTEEEYQKLLPALWKVDPRAWLVGEAYDQAGRRKNATRNLRLTDVRFATLSTEEGPVRAAILKYAAGTDKTKKGGEAVLVGEETLERLQLLMDMPAVRASGYLLPAGELSSKKAKKPIREETLNRMLHKAEEEAEIPHVKGRAYHAGKRGFGRATAGSRETASAQSGTTAQTLGRYDPRDDLPAQAALALEIVRRRV